ncbi:MAG: TetR/AcrR family transcriptional regulator [Clostridia bacterium]|nr:TetR/AcrR family transcriptional regulator [Clostridia bacterium]
MKKRTSKQIFVETFLELSRELPIDKITVKKIVEESGLSLKTFYNHFPDKYSLMLYIEQMESNRLHAKLSDGDMTFHEYLRAGIKYYQQIKHFLSNAFENTQGADSYTKIHAEEACRSILNFIQKKNDLTEIPGDVVFAERLYANGLVSSFFDYNFSENKLTEDEFIRYCVECIPEKLRPFLL